MTINQFHSGSAVGDAVTNQMLMICDMLRAKGIDSRIYAEFIPDELAGRILPVSSYKGNKDNILLVHHSMGFDGFERIVSLPDKKILVYHNITPEKYFDDEYTKQYIRKGRWQAAEYRKYVDYAIADSNYNRKELLSFGYKQVDVMPVHISVNRFDTVTSDPQVLDRMLDTDNILFVGRVVKNKCQGDAIRAFSLYNRTFNKKSRMIFVGDDSGSYAGELKRLSRALEIEDRVIFTGKVSESALKAYYECASLFLCMSEHEGFGVPLLEAMAMGVPVVAYKSSAISETMDGAGILLTEKNPAEIAALMETVLTDRDLASKIVEKQHERIKKLKDTGTERILFKAIKNLKQGGRKRTIQLQGPFETSYSLAIVNRKLIEAIDDLGRDDVSIYCTEGPGDYTPNPKNLIDKPRAKELWRRSMDATFPDVTIRNMYPPRVADVNGGINFQAFAWEESRVPKEFVSQFNSYLDGIGTTSEFVAKALEDSGLTIPVKAIGNGVELPDNFDKLPAYPLKTKKGLRFLHISSAFLRKGVNLLLEAYFASFTAQDDVCLVLKTFPNPHNNVGSLLKELKERYPGGPEVEWIDCDLPEEKLYGLYKAANCYVHSARGEGFGLPVAEAMLAKVPVIVSPNTGMADFCNEDTAALVPFVMEPAHSHVSVDGAEWARPDVNALGQRMKEFASNPDSNRVSERVSNAQKLISTRYTWEAVAKRWEDFIDWVAEHQVKPKVAMVSTWNNKCGIAEYTRFQCEAMKHMAEFRIYPNYGVELLRPDEDFVQRRTWHSAFSGNMEGLTKALMEGGEEIVHFQFNFGFFNLEELAKTIRTLHGSKQIVITFHKTKDSDVMGTMVSLSSITEELNMCARLVVHQPDDRELLLKFGVRPEIVEIIPHGQIVYEARDKADVRRALELQRSLILGGYGFLLPHKGILENIKALEYIKAEYPDVLYIVCCALHEAQESRRYLEECMDYVHRHGLEGNVVFETDFLELEESMALLQACDITLMTYLPTEESASGAVRFCAAAQRPLITTDQKIFDEFADCTVRVSGADPRKIADAVLKTAKCDQTEMLRLMRRHCEETSWDSVADRFDRLYRKLEGIENK